MSGTFAKTLFPAMRLGFIVLPADLADQIKPAINLTGQFAPLVLQAALADFIDAGLLLPPPQPDAAPLRPRRALFLKLLDDNLGAWLDPIDGRTGIQLAALFKTADQRPRRRRARQIGGRQSGARCRSTFLAAHHERAPDGICGRCRERDEAGLPAALREIIREAHETAGVPVAADPVPRGGHATGANLPLPG